MSLRFRVCVIGFTLATIISLVGLSEDADACGGRFRLFSSGFFGRRCAPPPCEPSPSVEIAITPVEPAKKLPPMVVEPIKEPPLPPVSKDMRVNVKNIAELLKKRNASVAKKLASAVAARAEVFEVMELYRPRTKTGIGWGPNPPLNQADDGIEKTLRFVAKSKPKNPVLMDSANHEEAAYWMLAMAELTIALAPRKDGGSTKTRQAWVDRAGSLHDAVTKMGNAAAGRDANAFYVYAAQANTTCIACHAMFKD